MPCTIKNPANLDLGDIEPHVQGMYDYFDQKIGFNKPPTMVFDSDPGNQANVLGKTAYYDPSTLEIHVYSDGRHPKDMLRSIAHELIHHRQNLEGRLDVGGYHGEGYYLENEELKKLEHEAMLEGNAFMREYEDTLKRKENKEMSLNEWKNNELNRLLMKKFGILKENKKPDYLDLDKDGDKEEPMKDAAKSTNEGNLYKRDDEVKEADDNDGLEELDEGETSYGHEKPDADEKERLKEDSGEEEKHHYEDNKMSDDDHIKAIEHHLAALKKDKNYDDDHEELEEGRGNPKTHNKDKFVGHEDKYHDDRIHENDAPVPDEKVTDDSDPIDSMLENEKSESLKEAIRRVLKKNKKIRLRIK
jgi:hypothetical protein